jgi:hypothetical protein
MKPYRVKRGGKFIGSFLVVHEGQRVNLSTKDASEARRRAALVERGEWPPEGNDAAKAVKAAIESVPAEPIAPMPESPAEQPTPEPTPAEPPPAAGVESVPPQSSAADAVNAAAAVPDDLENQAKAALAEAGLDLSEITAHAPRLLSGAHLWLQAQACRFGVRLVKGHLGTDKKWPAVVTLPPGDALRDLIGQLWVKKLESMNLDLSKLGFGWWLLLLSAAAGAGQVGAMLAEMQEAEAKEAAASAD